MTRSDERRPGADVLAGLAAGFYLAAGPAPDLWVYARQGLADLEHLVLEDDDPERLAQRLFQRRVNRRHIIQL